MREITKIFLVISASAEAELGADFAQIIQGFAFTSVQQGARETEHSSSWLHRSAFPDLVPTEPLGPVPVVPLEGALVLLEKPVLRLGGWGGYCRLL
ncbi:hypothetical protein CRG98_026532 [Punica granatum]|uniref:Uncharacterized protein n=1 Tax=Punica granatum TaxID=22663 RepID=A0A2I0J9Y4_PUNGR|nr:hypothetical protein CRG98_026532 [Punica granatum]